MEETTLDFLFENGFIINCQKTAKFTKQRGPTCGLYTIQNTQEGFNIPVVLPATKEGKEHTKSLRQIAKNEKYTAVGEVYDAKNFEKLAALSGLKTKLEMNTEISKFWETCQSVLKENCLIAVPVSNSIMKSEGNAGDNPHWVLVIGIKVGKDVSDTIVAITTWGKIYKVKFETLFLANQTINDRPQRYKKKIGKMKYDECNANDEGAIIIPEYKASVNLAKNIVILSSK